MGNLYHPPVPSKAFPTVGLNRCQKIRVWGCCTALASDAGALHPHTCRLHAIHACHLPVQPCCITRKEVLPHGMWQSRHAIMIKFHHSITVSRTVLMMGIGTASLPPVTS